MSYSLSSDNELEYWMVKNQILEVICALDSAICAMQLLEFDTLPVESWKSDLLAMNKQLNDQFEIIERNYLGGH